MHMAIGAVVNAAWDLRSRLEGAPLWKILSALDPEEIVRQIDFTYIDDAMEPAEALALLEAQGGRSHRADLHARAGWAGRLHDLGRVARLRRRQGGAPRHERRWRMGSPC